MIRHFLCFLLLGSVGSVFGYTQNYYLIDGQHEGNSVIKIWYTVLGLLDEFDKGENSGFEISFDGNGKYFSKDLGPNWWDYYFAFHAVGEPGESQVVRIPRYKRSTIRFKTVCTMAPERAGYLLNKYMRVQPAIEARLGAIKEEYFPHTIPVIGVYYQNPMMPEVQQSWDPIALADHVKGLIKDIVECKIYLFTDLEDFANIFCSRFGNQCGTQCMTIASLSNQDKASLAESGEHELLTLMLLAECDIVIAPGSYQGIGAKMLNPGLKLIELDAFPYALK
jgi:hypothetical protein